MNIYSNGFIYVSEITQKQLKFKWEHIKHRFEEYKKSLASSEKFVNEPIGYDILHTFLNCSSEKAEEIQWSKRATNILLHSLNRYKDTVNLVSKKKKKIIFLEIAKRLEKVIPEIEPQNVETKYYSLKNNFEEYKRLKEQKIPGINIPFGYDILKDVFQTLEISNIDQERNFLMNDNGYTLLKNDDNRSFKKYIWSPEATDYLLNKIYVQVIVFGEQKIDKRFFNEDLTYELANFMPGITPPQIYRKWINVKNHYLRYMKNKKLGLSKKIPAPYGCKILKKILLKNHSHLLNNENNTDDFLNLEDDLNENSDYLQSPKSLQSCSLLYSSENYEEDIQSNVNKENNEIWSKAAVDLLLNKMLENHSKTFNVSKTKNFAVYEDTSEFLISKNYKISAIEVENKWKSLYKKFQTYMQNKKLERPIRMPKPIGYKILKIIYKNDYQEDKFIQKCDRKGTWSEEAINYRLNEIQENFEIVKNGSRQEKNILFQKICYGISEIMPGITPKQVNRKWINLKGHFYRYLKNKKLGKPRNICEPPCYKLLKNIIGMANDTPNIILEDNKKYNKPLDSLIEQNKLKSENDYIENFSHEIVLDVLNGDYIDVEVHNTSNDSEDSGSSNIVQPDENNEKLLFSQPNENHLDMKMSSNYIKNKLYKINKKLDNLMENEVKILNAITEQNKLLNTIINSLIPNDKT